MEESKKRWRPTLKEYRALESELVEANEQCRIKSDYSERLAKDFEDLKSKRDVLEKSNQSLSDGISTLRNENALLRKENDELRKRIHYLETRNFWGRLFNK